MLNEHTQLKERIAAIKAQLLEVGDMRPGSLSQQFKNPKEKQGAFWQLNCTFGGKTSTEYVRPDSLESVRAELQEYLRFRTLVDQWIEASIQLSRVQKRRVKTSSG